MAISYPIELPNNGVRTIAIRATDVIGLQEAPLTLEQTVYDWGGDALAADVEYPPFILRADAEAMVAFLFKLRGRLGTFLMGDPAHTFPRGTWAGVPLVSGAHAAGARTVALKGFTAGATGKEGDWLQFGGGDTAELHKVIADFTADGAGDASAEIYPRTRRAFSDDAQIISSNAKGLWRLASNTREYSIGLARRYGLRFSCIEAL
jgi:hypothetical protein